MLSDSDIEIRPIFSTEDFGAELTPELREQEDRLRAATEKLAAGETADQASTVSRQRNASPVASPKLDPPRFEQGTAMRIAGLSATYDLNTRINIPLQWNRFQNFLRTIPGRAGGATYGVTSNFDHVAGSFDYLCGVEIEESCELPDGLTRIRVPAQRYAVFTHRGSVSEIEATFDQIWNHWLPNSGCRAVKTPCVECYPEDFGPDSDRAAVEIWIPIST